MTEPKGEKTESAAEEPQAGKVGTAGQAPTWAKFFNDLPASQSKPLTGSTTVKDGAGYPAELVAFSGLDQALSSIATAVQRLGVDDVLLVEDRAVLDSASVYLVVSSQLAAVEQRLMAVSTMSQQEAVEQLRQMQQVDESGELLKLLQAPGVRSLMLPVGAALPGIASALAAVPKIVGGAADIVGMFRTVYTMSSRTMTVEGTTVLAQLAGILESRVQNVRVDGFSAVPSESSSPLLQQLATCGAEALRLELASVALRATVAAATATTDALVKQREEAYTALVAVLAKGGDVAPLRAELADLDGRIVSERGRSAADAARLAEIDEALGLYATVVSSLFTAPAAGRPPILSALAREPLHIDVGPEHVLFVSIDSIGADIATPQSQLQTADYVLYVGGVQVSWMLLNVKDGTVEAADVKQHVATARLNLKDGKLTVIAANTLA